MAKKRKHTRKRPVKRAAKRPAKVASLKKKAKALIDKANKIQKRFEVQQKIKVLRASLKK